MNIALYLVSFEYDTQEELINMLLKAKSYEKYTSGPNYGKKKPLIQDVNVNILEKYQSLCNSLGKKPSIDLLMQEFPTLNFGGLVPLNYERLHETIKLDLTKLKQKDDSYKLMNLSTKVSVEGVSQEVLDEISDLAKTEHLSSKAEYFDILDTIKDIYTNASLEKGIRTGVKQVDEKTGGLQPGTFNTLAGYAGAGKTTAAVNIAYNALQDKKNVCYITLEVPKVDLNYDFLSRHSFEKKFTKQISHSIIKKRELSKQDTEYLFDTIVPDFKKEYDGQLYILDETDFYSYSFSAFESKIADCDTIAQQKTGRGIDLVIVDQAQLLKFGGGIGSAGSETSVINLYVSFFRQQAINFLHSKRPCTILMLSQINRDGFTYASKHDGMYSLTSLAEANELERAPAMFIALFTDESLKLSKQVKVQLLKSRNGETIMDPVISFMDPVYYVFGSELSDSGAMFQGNASDVLGLFSDM